MDTKARRRQAAPWTACLPVMVVLLLLPTAAAQAEEECEDDGLRLTAHEYVAANATATEDGLDAEAGERLTVRFTLEGCGTRTMSLAAYEASATGGREDQTVFDADTQVFGEGDHSMTVAVPPCHYQIDLVEGEVLWRFELPLVTYEAQSRLLATLQGGAECDDGEEEGSEPGPRGHGGGMVQAEGEAEGDATSQTRIGGDARTGADGIPCPTRIEAGSNADGGIVVEVDVAAEADATILYRATGSGAFEPVGKVDAASGQYVDFDTEAGVAYTYRAMTVVDGKESMDCPDVEITSMPVFPGVLGGALAALAGLAGYAVARRRR